MTKVPLPNNQIQGPFLIRLDKFVDDRGCFFELFRNNQLHEFELGNFVQDNVSVSQPGVLRGLHFQDPPQGKLVIVLTGRILDVMVDLRKGSPTWGHSIKYQMSSEAPEWLWVPPGFAHGFLAQPEEPATVLYRCSQYYNPSSESGIIWNDSDLKIDWGVSNPKLSKKDNSLPSSKLLFC